ncbi:MAG: NFACT family protein [Lachnospiraceae bacterium]|nr:NFACT family protein [Lachnospiraceae bacterium]
MAFDGITIACLIKELRETLIGGRLYKIAQPEPDELLLTIKNNGTQYRLVLSASASLPLVHLTSKNKTGPMTAPGFCMLLRKHLQNGRIVSVSQPSLERIIEFTIEHLDELGDLCSKRLIIELMGKHSNIIFCTPEGRIIDSIKHISAAVSSLREVLPGRSYFIPQTSHKGDPLTADREGFAEAVFTKPLPCHKALYTSFTGLSPFMAQEICHRASLSFSSPDGNTSCELDRSAGALSEPQREALFAAFSSVMESILQGDFSPRILYEGERPAEYSVLPVTMYPEHAQRTCTTLSGLLEQYYAEKNELTRIRQKSADLRRIVQTALERNIKKYDLQMRQIKDTEKKDKYKVYGELITAYGYNVAEGSRSMTVNNYYTGEDITIPLDPALSPIDNAKKYFEKYNKLKRTYEALSTLTLTVKAQIDHLESVFAALDIARQEADLLQIKEELIETGYIRRKGNARGGKVKQTSHPLHYISSDGFHMYVGKNNYQNEELTFRFASGNDWWFHAKGMPGSHVIVKTEGKELPDSTFEEAGRLAAFYSKAKDQEKAEIDYVERKHVKKPSGANPGFVVYYTNYSLMIDSDISKITQVEENR